jgi:hypothetical protein
VRYSEAGRDERLLGEEWRDCERGQRENTTSPKCFMVFHSFMTPEGICKIRF